MKLVIIESPYRAAEPGGIAAHVTYARAAIRDSITRGEAPVAFHLLYTQPGVLRDEFVEERALGIALSNYWTEVADFLAFYTDRGWSEGMLKAYDRAVLIGAPYKFRSLSNESRRGVPPPDAAIRNRPISQESP